MNTTTYKPHYLYRIKKSNKNIIKVGITSDIFSRMTGKYDTNFYNGLLSINIDIESSFYIELKNEYIAKLLEEKIQNYNKKYRIIYNKNLSGFTEWYKNGEEMLKNLKYFLGYKNKIIPLKNIFLERKYEK
ncbi:hypothetical protein [Arcobacter arenosus]|uniref:hypothetical protein n=1 Tax=Arcobacter arenosus TaxID=2576037 RepID=UPI003BAD07BB